MNGRYIDKTEEMITQQGVDNSSAKLYKKGTLLYSIFASIGEVGILNIDATCNQAIAGLEPKYNICKNYVYYVLKALKHLVCKKGRGVAQNNINLSILKNIEIPLPPKEEQERIAKELDAVSDLLSKQKQLLTEQDTLIKSVFYDMFGDPIINDKGWKIRFWEQVFNTKTGKLNANAMCKDGQYPFFTCSKEIYNIDVYAFDQKALLLAGNNATGKYDVKYYEGKFNAYQRTYILQLIDEQNSYMLFKQQLELRLSELQKNSKGINTKFLTMEILRKICFIVPPLPLQQKFADIVEQIEAQKQKIKSAITETETLFNALMAKYFDEE